jgi:hypothetical protein
MEQAPDRKRVQQFAPRKLFTHYTSGMLMLMVDIGRRTGLFEAGSSRSFTLPAEHGVCLTGTSRRSTRRAPARSTSAVDDAHRDHSNSVHLVHTINAGR